MLILLSSLTAVKDYLQIVHTFLESQPQSPLTNYWDGGAVLTYVVLLVKQLMVDVFTFEWLRQLGGLPQMVPDIASAMVSELSVWNQYAHQPFSVLDNPLVLTPNVFGKVLEQAVIGFLNSAFFLLPSSLSHIIIFRRFILQGVPSGRAAAWGTLLGNISWITAVIFGWRFLVIPWISLDWLRYGLGFTLILKYCWDTQEDRRQGMIRAPLGRYFFLNFLLAWTEQVTVYPFVSQLSMNAGASPMEGFAVDTWGSFVAVHGAYVLGLLLGSVSLLAAVQWFWENPFMRLYNWLRTTYRQPVLMYVLSTDFVRQSTLFLTMFAAMASFPYHALDYWVLNPLGFAHPDRLVYRTDEIVGPSSVPGEKIPMVKNHPWDLLGWFSERPEDIERSTEGSMRTKIANRWRRHVRRFKGFDSMLYDTGAYHLFSPEDVNFGFDRFWMRRGMRRKQIRFRLIPGPPARRLKRAVAKSRLTNQGGIRHEFFDRLEEQAFSSSLHEQRRQKFSFFGKFANKTTRAAKPRLFWPSQLPGFQDPVDRAAWVRKFARKASMRLRQMELADEVRGQPYSQGVRPADRMSGWVYSKFWKYARQGNLPASAMLRNAQTDTADTEWEEQTESSIQMSTLSTLSTLKKNERLTPFPSLSTVLPNGGGVRSERALDRRNMSRMERQWLRYASLLKRDPRDPAVGQGVRLLHPLQFYLQRERALERKWQYYRPKVTRRYAPGQTSTFFRTILNRVFVYPRATRRWHTTIEAAQNEVASAGASKGRRKRTKTSRLQKRWEPSEPSAKSVPTANGMGDSLQEASRPLKTAAAFELTELGRLQKPTHSYRIGSVNASRYRHHMLKQTLENWYYQRPLRRFLMAWDIDSFLRRQPRAHRLSPAEETLLHVRRGLLLDHYNSLRWYRWMQHYSSMKQATGGVKSAANTLYAQQFQGTLKNVRHLFVLTPSDGPRRRLTFDQPLINEYVNTSDASLVDQSWMHEELLPALSSAKEDGLEKMRDGLKGYNQRASNVRAHLLQAWVKSKRPFELAQFDLKGQKTRGQAALTQERRWAHQEAPNLLTYSDWTKQQNILNDPVDLNQRTARAWMQHLKTSSRFLRPLKLTRKRDKERLDAHLKRWNMRNQRAQRLRQQARRWMSVEPQRPRAYGLGSQGTRTPTGLVQGYVDALQDTYASGEATVLRGRAAVTSLSNWEPIPADGTRPGGLLNTVRARLSRLSRLFGWRGAKRDQSPWDEKLQSQWRAAESVDQESNNAPRSYPNAQTEAQRLLEQLGVDAKQAKEISKKKSLDPVYMQQLRFRVRAKNPLQELQKIEAAPPKGAGAKRFLVVEPLIRNYLRLIIRDETLKKKMRIDPNFKTLKNWASRDRMALKMQGLKKRLNREARMLIEADQPVALTQQMVGIGQRMLNRDREAVEESLDPTLLASLREPRTQLYAGKRLFFKRDGDNNENAWKSGSQREIGRPIRELGVNVNQLAAGELNVWHAPPGGMPLRQNLPLSRPGTPDPLSVTDVTQENVDRTLESIQQNGDADTVWKEYEEMMALAPSGDYNAGVLKRLIALTDHLKRRRAEEVANFGWWTEALPRLQNETTDGREQQLKSMLQDPAIQKLYPSDQRSQTFENLPLGTLDRWPGHVTPTKTGQAAPVEAKEHFNFDFNAIEEEKDELEKGQRWQSTHPMPFYAGWDESQRKLVVTNRLRSRLEMVDDFQGYPLRGLNEGSGSWNLPFVTFAPIQNSARAKNIFAPLGWRRLQLRHSLIQAWQRAPRSALRLAGAPDVTMDSLVVQPRVWNRSILDRVKQTQRAQQRARLSFWHSPYEPALLAGRTGIPLTASDLTPLFPGYPANRMPVGPLSAEVLPNHFLWAFQPRDSRLSLVRYMSRWPQTEWRSGFERKKERILGPSQDFTWRRRALPKRKRHRKWANHPKGQNRGRTMVEPRRRAWLKSDRLKKRWRPSGSGMAMSMATPMKGDKGPGRLRFAVSQYRYDPRTLSYQRQQIIPLPGGFLWPGDYARLQAMPIPLERASLYDPSFFFHGMEVEEGQKEPRPMAVRRAKGGREVSLPDLTHDPVTYLAERHNQVVLKKRLRKTGHASQSYGTSGVKRPGLCSCFLSVICSLFSLLYGSMNP